MKLRGWILWLLLTLLDSILWAVFHKVVCLPIVEATKCSLSAFLEMTSAADLACWEGTITPRLLLDSSVVRNLTSSIEVPFLTIVLV